MHPPQSSALRGALALACCASLAAAQQLEVHVIDVEQGLSVFVKSPTGVRLLIDGGNPGDGNAIVRPYLQSKGVGGLDYSVMTHWHTDHFGGLTDIHNSSFEPAIAAYDRGDLDRPSNGFVSSYLSAVGSKRAIPVLGQVISLGGGATAKVISINGNHLGGYVDPSGDENAYSLGVLVEYGSFDLYVGGDLTGGGLGTPDVEGPASVAVGRVEVALASHHGSSSSSSATTVAALDPSLVIHSAGLDNPYGHPTEDSIDRWNSTSAARVQWCTTEGDTVLATGGDPGGFNAVNGHILITTDGATFTATSSSNPESVTFATWESATSPAGPSQIAINELLVDPQASADLYGEWFELINVSAQALDLSGIRFVSGSQSFTLRSRVLLAPAARFLVGVDGRRSRNGDVFPGIGAPWQQFSLANSSGSLEVRSSTNVAIETASWGGAGFAVTPGVSAERIVATSPPSAANFADATNAWSAGDLGTPWEENDAAASACPTPVPYGTGKLNSNGTVATVTWTGTPSLTTDDFAIAMVDAVPQRTCICFWGSLPAAKPFYGGTLWVKAPLARMGVQTTDFYGAVSYPVPIDPSMPGSKRYYQCWYRDPLIPDGTNVGLSAALEVQFCPLPLPALPGDLVITEVMKDPASVADSSGEWIEIFNRAASAVDLEGWTLRDDGTDAHVIANGGQGVVIAPGARLVLGANANAAVNGGVAIGYEYTYTQFQLSNADDEVVLVAPDGTEWDRIVYDNGVLWPDFPGASLTLDPAAVDTVANDDGNNWCAGTSAFGAGDSGTPGAANDDCP
jgi:beta-lactamase superfamily II metal-dependent hydrolase